MNRKLFLYAGLAALMLTGCRGGGGSSGGSMGSVNGDSIDYNDYYAYMGTKPTVAVKTGNGIATAEVAGTIALQSLIDMVRQKALLQLAKDEGVAPKPEDITKELAFQKKLNPDFVKQLRAAGYTLERINDQLEIMMAERNVITKGITISKQEIDEFIANNKKAFRRPAMVSMLWVFAKTIPNRDRIDAELKKGALFASVAQQFGEQPNARTDGGRFRGNQNIEAFQPALRKYIEATEPGKVTQGPEKGWIPVDNGWAKFYIEKKTKAEDIPIDDTRREAVRRELAQRRGKEASNLQSRIDKRVLEAKVSIQDKVLKEQWDQYIKSLKETVSASSRS